MNPWLLAAALVVSLALFGWGCWRVRTRLGRDEPLEHPGSDAQWAQWINDQKLADRAERQGRQDG